VGGLFCTWHSKEQKNGLWEMEAAQPAASVPLPAQPAAEALALQPAQPAQPAAEPIVLQPAQPAQPADEPIALQPPTLALDGGLFPGGPVAGSGCKHAAPLHLPVRLALCNAPWADIGAGSQPPLKKRKLSVLGATPKRAAAPSPILATDNKLQPSLLAKVIARSANKKCDTQQKEATAYALFCQANSKELGQLPNIGQLVQTKVGSLWLSEVGINAYLVALMDSLVSRTVYEKFLAIKAGLRSLGLPGGVLPAWMEPKASPPTLVNQTFRQQKQEDYKSQAPAKEKGFIEPDKLMSYVLDTIAKDIQGLANQVQMRDALVLWVMVGRSHRFVNLNELQCANVGQLAAGSQELATHHFFLNLATTKALGSMSASQIVDARVVVRFTLKDAISKYLVQAWLDCIPAETSPTYFFPHAGTSGFEWGQKMSYKEMDCAVLQCAYFLDLVNSQEHSKTFTSKSLRSGVAAQSYKVLREVVSCINPRHGRSQCSKMDQVVYCPKSVMTEPGLLHHDLEGIQAAFDLQLHCSFGSKKDTLLCKACGCPWCECSKCRYMACGGKGHASKHTCWLQNRGCGKKAKDWIYETVEQFEERCASWSRLGISSPPLFSKGFFQFME
jgi:hypothetical protein